MEPNNNIQIPHIKAGSIVPLNLNLGHVHGLYNIYQTILETFGKDNIEGLKA